jgi:ParB-like chromosome segregation protein Spo0J
VRLVKFWLKSFPQTLYGTWLHYDGGDVTWEYMQKKKEQPIKAFERFLQSLEIRSLDERVEVLNQLKTLIHENSPFKAEPVDCVLWKKTENIKANDYNPNTVAPPEMKLLATSIIEDGYTQPIVAWRSKDDIEVIDGFHRNRVGREVKEVSVRIKGYLPVVVVNESRLDRGDRIASTIRHNRARGKHGIAAMSDIVLELKRRNWSDKKISDKLGMDQDEVLRLTQITGLAEMFKDRDFSAAWEVEKLEEKNITDNETLD